MTKPRIYLLLSLPISIGIFLMGLGVTWLFSDSLAHQLASPGEWEGMGSDEQLGYRVGVSLFPVMIGMGVGAFFALLVGVILFFMLKNRGGRYEVSFGSFCLSFALLFAIITPGTEGLFSMAMQGTETPGLESSDNSGTEGYESDYTEQAPESQNY